MSLNIYCADCHTAFWSLVNFRWQSVACISWVNICHLFKENVRISFISCVVSWLVKIQKLFPFEVLAVWRNLWKCNGNKLERGIQISKHHVLIKRQISILNLNMQKSKWDGAEEPTINHFYKIGNLYWISNRPQKLPVILLCDIYPLGPDSCIV